MWNRILQAGKSLRSRLGILAQSIGHRLGKSRMPEYVSAPALKVRLKKLYASLREHLKQTLGYGVEFTLGMKIRWKLILIVGISIVAVTFIVSTVAVNRQEEELQAMTAILGLNLVQSLGNVAQDNLLLESYPPIQDYINNLSTRSFPGLEYFFVMDRNGSMVAHSRADQINRLVPPDEFDLITGTDSALVLETDSQLRFVQSVRVRKDGVQYVLGGTSATFSKDAMYARIAEMRGRILLTGVLVSLFAISIVYLFSTKIVGIIVVLSEAARKVGEGDLKVAVVTRIKDELGVLAKEFNMMVVQIREKTEMQKFVSRAAVQMISEHKESSLGGTRRVITAMFTDIRNFTSVAETQWPEEVVVTLNHYLDVQTKVIHDCGGVVDKFIGDGIMSFFTGNDMVANSLKAAVKIQQEVDLMNKRRKKNNEIVLEIGIGIATGVAVMGSIGSADRMDYTAIGDTVNLAARLCGVAGPNEILVSETVITRMNGKIKAVSAGKIPIKGKAEKVAVFQIPSNTETA